MIAVDSSVLVAVVLGEPEAEGLLAALQAQPAVLSAVNLVEASIVVESRQGLDTIDEVAPVDAELSAEAVEAWRRFGKGRHPAGLNVGDCFAYALAHSRGLPLLFTGNDFTQTDIAAA